jgi:hypothetical protein
MADLPSTPQPGELAYRPLSGLALTGFILSSVFTGMVLLSTTVGLAQGLPVFLPGWALGLAVAAAVVCFLAQQRIQSAEGTLAGLALARWGLWLSVLLGVTYFVYTWVTGLALAKQANDFLTLKTDEDTGFFPRLRNSARNRTDLYQAFLLSLPITSRGGSKASNEQAMLDRYDQPGKDGEGGNISKFSKHPLVLALSKNPDNIQIEPLSVADWNHDKNAYHVVRNYRFITPELLLEIPIAVQSTEGASEGEQRKWFVDLRMTPPKFSVKKPTPYGEKLLALRYYSKGFLEKWRGHLLEGTPATQYKETDTDWSRVLRKQEQRDHVQKVLGEIFRCERKAPVQMMVTSDDDFADWSAEGGHIHVVHPMKMLLPAGAGYPAFNLELEVTAATTDSLDLSAPLNLPIAWGIRKIRVSRAAVASKMSGPT